LANILIIYSTTDGHTIRICHKLQEVIERQAHQVKIISVQNEPQVELASFDKIVIGASIRYGKHSLQIIDFIKKNEQILTGKPNAFFWLLAVMCGWITDDFWIAGHQNREHHLWK